MRTLIILTLVFVWVSTAAAQSIDREKELQGLAAAEREFAAYTVKNGFRDGFIKYFAEDGIGFGPHPERTREKLSKTPAETGPRPIVFNWAPMFGDVSAAGDLGYTTGPVLYTDTSANPRPPRHGMYFSVWQKQADGTWRVVVDMGTQVPEAVGPIETKFTAAERIKKAQAKAHPAGDLRQVDERFSAELARLPAAKAYASWVDHQFRIHRRGNMPITSVEALGSNAIVPAKFELIGGKTALSGDLGYTYGKYTAGTASGYYVHVWRRDGSGDWKLVAEVENELPKT